MKTAITLARLLLGLVFFVFGLNLLLNFMPWDIPTGLAGEFVMGLSKSEVFIPILGIMQTVFGLALLLNRFVPLVLIVLFPINLNMFVFYAVMEPSGMALTVLVNVLNVFLLYAYRNHFVHFAKAEAKHSHH